MQDRFAMMCCHGRIGNHFGGIFGAISGLLPSVCTRAQSECRPLEYRRPHSAMSLSKTSPRILCLWQKWHRLDQALIFTALPWYTGLVGPFASLALPAGGFLLAFDHPSMFLFFLCVRTRTRAMMFSPWWKKERVADSDISMTTEGSHSLLSRQCHDLYYPRDQAPKVGTLASTRKEGSSVYC